MMKCEEYALLNQSAKEMRDFIDLIKVEEVKSYLEIGSKYGGSLWPIGNALPRGSRIVSVDMPHESTRPATRPALEECVRGLVKRGYDAHLIIGDCTDEKIVEKVRSLGPYDLCFIDANHAEPFVRADWSNYGPMAKMVAFHDISFFREGGLPPHKNPIDVPWIWKEIKRDFQDHLEIRHDPKDNGIGVLWR